jgi:aspartate kinase
MARIVLKFGGTSVGDTDRIKNVARKVKAETLRGNEVAVVVSAMTGATNQLVKWVNEIAPLHDPREYDVVVATGEQVTIGLLAMALQQEGVKSRSWTSWQIPVKTDDSHAKARILEIDMAAALKADRCDIYTDVDGVYTTDPRIVEKARKIDRVTYEEMLEMASQGSKVLQTRSVELAMNHHVRVQVLSSFDAALGSDLPGTLVVDEEEIMSQGLEKSVVSGIAFSRDEAKITVVSVADRPGIAAAIFGPLAGTNINVDMIVQNVSLDGSSTDITFTVPRADLARAVERLENARADLKFAEIKSDINVAKISVIGVGMRSHAGVALKMFETLAAKGINIQVISTSEIKVSVLVADEYTELAVRALHTAYELDAA